MRTRQQFLVTRINQDISDIQLQQTTMNTMANVRNAYWDYVFAVQSVDVARQSLQLADELLRNNQTKVEIGTMAPIDVVQAQAQAAQQRQALVTAEGSRRTAEIALKRLIVSGTADPLWTSTIEPVDRPDFRPEPIDLARGHSTGALDEDRRPAGAKKSRGQRRYASAPRQPEAASGRSADAICDHGHRRHPADHRRAQESTAATSSASIPAAISMR